MLTNSRFWIGFVIGLLAYHLYLNRMRMKAKVTS